MIKCAFGLLRPTYGKVTFEGEDITRLSPAQRLGLGIGYVPQLPSVFPSMSVTDNLQMGLYGSRSRVAEHLPVEFAFDLFPRLGERRSAIARSLSGGERRMLEIGRTMLLRPKLILLDEPSVGLSPLLTAQLFETLSDLRDRSGVAILLIEQNARTALEMCDTGVVLVSGRIAYQGSGGELLADDEVRRSFLGGVALETRRSTPRTQ